MTVVDRIVKNKTGSIYFDTSIKDGLTGLFQPRKSAADSVVNRAPSGVNGIIYGNPDFGVWSGVFGRDGGIDTLIKETKEFTIISIATLDKEGGHAFISSLNGGQSDTPNVSLMTRKQQPSRYGVSVKSTPVSSNEYFGLDIDELKLLFMSASCDGERIKLSSPGLPTNTPGGNPRVVQLSGARDASNNYWRIGSSVINTSLYGSKSTHYLDLIYNRSLSDLEIKVIYAEAAEYFRSKGIYI